jgi:hypothetical protein
LVRKGGEKEYMKYFGGETSWKMKEKWEYNIDLSVRK